MNADGEFDDFLARRRPVFRTPPDDVVGPPESIDRAVLRQAREAIESDRPLPLYRGPGWGVPLAVAATVLLALAVVLQVELPRTGEVPAVETRSISQQREASSASNNLAAPAPAPAGGLGPPAPPPPPPVTSRTTTGARSPAAQHTVTTAAPPAVEADRAVASPATAPEWRRDAQSWLAEIERLRTAGRTVEAEAELAEYKRQHRAYAGAPDR